MSESMTKRQRLSRVMAGQPVDRLPWSLWRHFYVEETAAETLARRLADWHRQWDFDFVKVNVRAEYHTQGWGSQWRYSGREHDKPERTALAITEPQEFESLEPLDPWAWPLGEMIELVTLLREDLGPDEVLLMTVFNPMSVAYDLIGGQQAFARALAEHPKAVHRGLRVITDTFRDFAQLVIDRGADGLFLATTHMARAEEFTLEQFEEFGRPYDMEILEAADAAWMNMLHVCGENAYVQELSDYPVQALNWDTNAVTNPGLAEMRPVAADKVLVGGLTDELFSEPGGGEQLVREVAAAREAMGDRPFVLGSTCTISSGAREENIEAVRRAVCGE